MIPRSSCRKPWLQGSTTLVLTSHKNFLFTLRSSCGVCWMSCCRQSKSFSFMVEISASLNSFLCVEQFVQQQKKKKIQFYCDKSKRIFFFSTQLATLLASTCQRPRWIMLEMDAFISTSFDLPEICRQKKNGKEPYWLHVVCHEQLNLNDMSIREQNGKKYQTAEFLSQKITELFLLIFCNVCEKSACNRSLICDYLHLYLSLILYLESLKPASEFSFGHNSADRVEWIKWKLMGKSNNNDNKEMIVFFSMRSL